jgi:hypothetical protein
MLARREDFLSKVTTGQFSFLLSIQIKLSEKSILFAWYNCKAAENSARCCNLKASLV